MANRDNEFRELWNRAAAAGITAFNAARPTPMIVQQHADMFNDRSPVTRQWYVPDGPCGFGWISLRPATSAFARWLKKNRLASTDSYAGGLYISSSHFTPTLSQSLDRNAAAARAAAAVLSEAGYRAYGESRID